MVLLSLHPQVGWLQTPAINSQYAMRSQKVNLPFYKKLCQDTFGTSLWPLVDRVNLNLGGLDIQTSNLIMTNGSEDPWQEASLLEDKGDIQSVYIECDDCAHCVELYTPRDTDSIQLRNARDKVSQFVSRVLKN